MRSKMESFFNMPGVDLKNGINSDGKEAFDEMVKVKKDKQIKKASFKDERKSPSPKKRRRRTK